MQRFRVVPRSIWYRCLFVFSIAVLGSRSNGLRGNLKTQSDQEAVTLVHDKGFKVASVTAHTLLGSAPVTTADESTSHGEKAALHADTSVTQQQKRPVVYLPLNLPLLNLLLERAASQRGAVASISKEYPRSKYRGSRHLGGPKSRILFHHIWKCAGANLCSMAVRNGESVPDDDPTNPSARCELDSLDAHELITGNYSFASLQAPLPSNLTAQTLPPEVSLVTVLRNPLNQALSHYRHAQEDYGLWSNFSEFLDYGLCVSAQKNHGRLETCQAHLRTLSFKALDSFALFRDNQQVRWLEPTQQTTELDPFALGVGDRPVLSNEDLQAAKARLDMYDEVLILEDLHKRDRFHMQRYGWTILNDYSSANEHEPLKIWQPADAEADLKEQPAVLARLREIQRWDLELYRYGCELARRRDELRKSNLG